MNMPPWRTVLPVEETGRFTREQLDDAVCLVMERRRAGRPMVVRERGPEWGVPAPPPEAPAASEPVPYSAPRRRRGRRRPEAGG